MKYLNKYLAVILFFISSFAFSQEKTDFKSYDFNGFVQLNARNNINNDVDFSVRRLKFWLKSNTYFSKHWSYKIQTVFCSNKPDKFNLEDVKVGYKVHLFSFEMGQLVPEYSLERFQSDYKLPIIERAEAVNVLIPDGTLGVRDLGIQMNYKSKDKHVEIHVGFFNGNGVKVYKFNNKGFLITQKTALVFPLHNYKIKLGYSLAYRKADLLNIPKLLPPERLFSGSDFRYNFFVRCSSHKVSVQAEYLSANLNGEVASGYYVLTALNIRKSQVMMSFEKYKSLIYGIADRPLYHLGYNYALNGYKLKVFFDNSFQFADSRIVNYVASLQFQIFFN